jgi:hypothetical protein
MRRVGYYFVSAILWCSLEPNALAERVILFPVSEQSASDRTFPGANGIYDGLYDSWFDNYGIGLPAFHGLIDYEVRSALEFDLRAISPNEKLTSATLLFHMTTLGHGEVPLVQLLVEGYAGNGAVELRDMSAMNRVGTVDFPLDDLSLRDLELSVTDFVQTLQTAGVNWAGFTLRTTPGVSLAVGGSGFDFAPWRPRLQIETRSIPELRSVDEALIGICLWYFFHLCLGLTGRQSAAVHNRGPRRHMLRPWRVAR